MQRYGKNFVIIEASSDYPEAMSKNEAVGHYFNWVDSFSHRQNDRVEEDLISLKKLPANKKYLTTIREYTGHKAYRATLIQGNGGPKDAIFISKLVRW